MQFSYRDGFDRRRSLSDRQGVVEKGLFGFFILSAIGLKSRSPHLSFRFFLCTYVLGDLFVVFATFPSRDGG